MFGIELIRDDRIAGRATVVLDNLEEALRVAKELTSSADQTSQKVRFLDRQGTALGVYYASADRFVPSSNDRSGAHEKQS